MNQMQTRSIFSRSLDSRITDQVEVLFSTVEPTKRSESRGSLELPVEAYTCSYQQRLFVAIAILKTTYSDLEI